MMTTTTWTTDLLDESRRSVRARHFRHWLSILGLALADGLCFLLADLLFRFDASVPTMVLFVGRIPHAPTTPLNVFALLGTVFVLVRYLSGDYSRRQLFFDGAKGTTIALLITAIPDLLELLDLKGAVVTIDAMGCQKEIAADIISGGGEYVLAVKENQPHLYEDIERAFEEVLDRGEPGVDFTECQTEEVRRDRSSAADGGRDRQGGCREKPTGGRIVRFPTTDRGPGRRSPGLWPTRCARRARLRARRSRSRRLVAAKRHLGEHGGRSSDGFSSGPVSRFRSSA